LVQSVLKNFEPLDFYWGFLKNPKIDHFVQRDPRCTHITRTAQLIELKFSVRTYLHELYSP
jgi:hypothetical protein